MSAVATDLGPQSATASPVDVELLRAENECLRRELRSLLYAVGNDLRGPAHLVTSYAELLREGPDEQSPAEVKLRLRHLQDAASDLNIRLAGVLECAGLATQPVEPKPLDLARLVAMLELQLQREISAASAQISVSTPAARITTDEKLLFGILHQLVENALKFRDPGRPCAVEVSAFEERGKLCIEVRDNGVGFPTEDCRLAFQLFKRLKNSVGVPGYGIGLTHCEGAARRLGATIDASSEPDLGTAVTVRFGAGVMPR